MPPPDTRTTTQNSVAPTGTGIDADREQTAEKLLRASVRHSYDPDLHIDWDAPHEPDRYWLPPHRSSLYGTGLWDRLTEPQRIELTKHEVANAASAGVWFETLLIRMLAREYYDMDPRSRHAQYALTEIADECRHSIMFGKMVEALGCPAYPASKREHVLGRYLVSTARGPRMYASILIAEEVLDALQREIMVDESLQPLIRMVSRIHVVEEARHVRFAREEVIRQAAALGPIPRAYAQVVIGRSALMISKRLTHPGVYASVGLDPRAAQAAARANPHFRATLKWTGARVSAFLTEHGLTSGPGRPLWQLSGLL
jgi:hypothetical protein